MVSAVAELSTPNEFMDTDLGPLPVDWVIRRVDDVCTLVNGRGFKPYEWRDRGLPIIRIQNLNGSDEFNYFDGAYNRKIEVDTGHLLFAWSGSRGTSFGPHIWFGPLGVLNYHTWKVVVDEKAVLQDFFFHALKGLTEYIEDQAHGAAALVHVQKWQMEGFQLALPPTIEEQQAIAAALSDADALIEGLESLIAKKRAIKQGAMQELLSGRRRLAGFSEEWEARKFGAIATIRNDKINTLGAEVAAFCVELEQIDQGTGQLLGYSDARTRVSVKYRFQTGDALFGRLRPYLRKYWSADRNGVCSTEIWPLIPKGAILVAAFLAQIVKTDAFVEAASSSYGTHMPRSDWKALAEYEIALPTDLDEQRAIAAVLSGMDAELEALTSRLIKARQIKQGMMQELLTGQVRLV